MVYKSAERPRCRYCGKAIAKQTATMNICRKRDPKLKNDWEFWRHLAIGNAPWPRSIRDCQKLTNEKVVSITYGAHIDNEFDLKAVRSFTIWDGESYKDGFFCNGDHAKQFGYAAARKGLAMPAWKEKVEMWKGVA